MRLGEERIFATTNYFEELTNFYPESDFTLYFVGPELSSERSNKEVKINERLRGHFKRDVASSFVMEIGQEKLPSVLPKESSFFIGFNPGFGSGYDKLLESWAIDLVVLLSLGYPIVFTQANDYSVILFI